ncbi:hypothetical protein OE88DRAFT_887378 [Heliocybe sulcata]|uniref:Uncharacterized protein n=1 Tax=Heliocybe sulcata TaxID=5364 RepID=A0A5C3MSH0_9AGAM|nr:hypothetical protein OE88DRAFT_887378 [Heliocybe sulcata]
MDKAVYNRDRSDSPRSRKAADAVALDLTGSSDDDKVASDPAQPIIDLLQSRRLPLDVFLPALKRCDVVDHESLLMLATDVDSDLIDGMLKEHIGSGKYNVVQVQVFKTALRKLILLGTQCQCVLRYAVIQNGPATMRHITCMLVHHHSMHIKHRHTKT